MPRRTGTAPYDALRSAFDAQAGLVVDALARTGPQAPTRCEGWSVGHLDRHLGAGVQALADRLAEPSPLPPDRTVEGWAAALPALGAAIDADARSDGPGLAQALPCLRAQLAAAAPDTVVEQRTGRHPLSDALLFGLLELVVHGGDLPDPVVPDRRALRLVVQALAAVLAERAPGRHVEARVPPYVAVQCVEGPRHTRGTPPNVVEADPVAFVELCTGRATWADAVADGRVRTWGDRADLSRWLPLLA